MAPRKVRLIVDLVRGMSADDALTQLHFSNKDAAGPVKKLIESAIANAEHNFKLDRKNLTIKEIAADDGPTYKRWKPRAYGRATEIRKRTSHISLTLEDATASEKTTDTSKKRTTTTKKKAASESKDAGASAEPSKDKKKDAKGAK